MITEFSLYKSTIFSKIAILVRLINKYPKIKNSSLSLYFLKGHMNIIKEICRENAGKFEEFE